MVLCSHRGCQYVTVFAPYHPIRQHFETWVRRKLGVWKQYTRSRLCTRASGVATIKRCSRYWAHWYPAITVLGYKVWTSPPRLCRHSSLSFLYHSATFFFKLTGILTVPATTICGFDPCFEKACKVDLTAHCVADAQCKPTFITNTERILDECVGK